jgi:hypothetical protein
MELVDDQYPVRLAAQTTRMVPWKAVDRVLNETTRRTQPNYPTPQQSAKGYKSVTKPVSVAAHLHLFSHDAIALAVPMDPHLAKTVGLDLPYSHARPPPMHHAHASAPAVALDRESRIAKH